MRRMAKRARRLVRILAWLAVLIHPIFITLALLNEYPERPRLFRLGGIYFSAGLLVLLLDSLYRRAKRRSRRERALRRAALREARAVRYAVSAVREGSRPTRRRVRSW